MILALFLALSIPTPNLDGVLSLMGPRSMAHACPIGPNRALTNGHVIGHDWERFIWESDGHLGLLGAPSTTEKDRFRDLGTVRPWGGQTFPRWYAVAKQPPQVGDRVYFRAYDFRRKKDAFAPVVVATTVVRVLNGHVIYSPAGTPGSSGSCVLNQAGEVVAINAAGMELGDKNVVGIAVGIWEPLLGLGIEEDAN